MKVKELIEVLKPFEDFDVEISLLEPDGSSWGISCRTFNVEGIEDIGYSDKIVSLKIIEVD